MSERLYDYVPHEVKRRARTTRASLMALEEAFVSNPKPNAFLRKQLAKTIVMPERSVQVCEIVFFWEKLGLKTTQVWFQNRYVVQEILLYSLAYGSSKSCKRKI